ncbi:hypothetical protein DFH05DRAFT_1463489 [Lentinula detonsa]|uniref:HAT C-terminal dimerisation domain-containing protein n=1 Tax=Lentinula detonsa TaxID=2804962 RepID=A0A9W8TTT6_9AGAR|nr:hypothetical protein DFH05DRAFT_1463489 [Lentinula detonsa]
MVATSERHGFLLRVTILPSWSSKRTFSGGGLTLTKLCNWLNGQIVEALQVTKSTLRKDLIVREPPPSSLLETELQADEEEEEKFSEKVCTKDDSFVIEIELDSDAEE